MKKEIARFQRHKHGSVLLLMDVDHFKSVNDRHGHPAGDQVLKGVSAVCLEQLRADDSFGRIGGEEFAILLSDTELAGGMAAAEKFRRSIQELCIDVGGGISVTASFGIHPLTSKLTRPDDWLAEADRALYEAKRQGRNRCVLAGSPATAVAA
jgi:diguanylate cyclase (GGDEF)-like protein